VRGRLLGAALALALLAAGAPARAEDDAAVDAPAPRTWSAKALGFFVGPEYKVTVVADAIALASDVPTWTAALEADLEDFRGVFTAMAAELGMRPPAFPVAVILCKDRKSFEYAASLIGSRAPRSFARPKERMAIVENEDDDVGRIVYHEVVHILVGDEFHGREPIWFTEGLADHLAWPPWRGDRALHLEQAFRYLRGERKEPLPLHELLDADFEAFHWNGPEEESLHYMSAHLFCAFLRERGWLAAAYRGFRDRPADRTGRMALGAVTGMGTEALGREFRKWAVDRALFRTKDRE
jgi:hypothetical protein